MFLHSRMSAGRELKVDGAATEKCEGGQFGVYVRNDQQQSIGEHRARDGPWYTVYIVGEGHCHDVISVVDQTNVRTYTGIVSYTATVQNSALFIICHKI